MTIPLNRFDDLEDTDLLACTDTDGVTYKVTGAQFKELFEDDSFPWDDHAGGVIHIITDNVDIMLNNDYVIWDIDGKSKNTGHYIPKNSEKVFLTTTDCSELFSGWDLPSNRYMTCSFGPLTDTSRVQNMKDMFSKCEYFNADIGDWDVSEVTNMDNMFDGCYMFQSDLSEWCVSKIPSQPANFAPVLSQDKTPVWGTCPRGEDQNQ